MIVSCGEALVDLVPHPEPGGGPMNVAVAAARLGGDSAFVGRVSTDEYGQLIWRFLEENGVDLSAAQRGDEPTARAIVEHVPELRFRFEGEATADTALRDVDLGRLPRRPRVLHGGTLGMFRGRTAETLAALVEATDAIVSLDPNVRPMIIDDRAVWEHYHSRWLERAAVYKASNEDLEWIWPGRDLESVAEELLAGAADVVLATHGADGAECFTPNGSLRVGGVPTDVVDTVGAGDTFMAAMLVDIASFAGPITDIPDETWRMYLGRAVAAAAVTCSRPGADPPTRAELAAVLGRGS